MPEALTPTRLEGWPDPVDIHLHLAATRPHHFWLDAGPAATDGWSVIGTGEPVGSDTVREVTLGGASDGVRFGAGFVGWWGYEPAAEEAGAPIAEPDPSTPDATVPENLWLRVGPHIVYDHALGQAWAYGDVSALLPAVAPTRPTPPVPDRVARGRHAPAEYAALIERCRDAIREGDAYQLCLTTRFSIDGEIDPTAAYLALRDSVGAHHGGVITSGPVSLLSASPETFLEVSDGVVRTRPIKGTRPRGTTTAADAALAAELQASEKERAENVMIVDLMRNDLSRVSQSGTVAVTGLLEVESYPAVHQLVSTVTGILPAEATVGDLLEASFPAGSMTGTPKLSAMTILNDLEGAPRGVFSGCYGWIGDDGAVGLAMVIRSIVVHPAGAYVGAGGGITWRSIVAEEVAEVGIKARAPLAAAGATLPAGW